jgi:hypothetical protein
MENVEELIQSIKTDLLTFDTSIIFNIKNICFKNYNYKPRFNEVNIIIHEWKHKIDNSILTLDTVRKFLTDDLLEIMSKLQYNYLQDSQKINVNDDNQENLIRKIKKIAYICIILREGYVFKAFIDNYSNGYFN